MLSRPLQGIRVLDLSHARSGPACVRVFADWGADVIRIEPPASVESNSNFIGAADSSDYQNLHRNKRSMTLNLKTDDGLRIFYDLVKTADVLIENMRADAKHRLKIDYETLHAINPRLIYGSISGFGQEGPYAARPGVDQIAQGMGGLMSITGTADGGPQRVGIAITDLCAGSFLAQGLLIALIERDRTGKGKWVTTSLLESMIAMLDFQATRWLSDGVAPKQEGNNHPTGIPTGVFPTSDGQVNIAATGNAMFSRLCSVIDLEPLLEDPRFGDGQARLDHREALNAEISVATSRVSTTDLVERLNAAGVPCGPIYTIPQMFEDPQVLHLDMAKPVIHPRRGELSLVAQPYTISGYDRALGDAAPELGNATVDILGELSISPAEIDRFRHTNVI